MPRPGTRKSVEFCNGLRAMLLPLIKLNLAFYFAELKVAADSFLEMRPDSTPFKGFPNLIIPKFIYIFKLIECRITYIKSC